MEGYLHHLKRAIMALAAATAVLRAILEVLEHLLDCAPDDCADFDERLSFIDPPTPP